uniref:Transposase n=1 Tax=Candidatus Kentrum sp. TC TaxID=2126339 RepID=A0A450YH18_9GAMM|nr:MAG: Putative transposase [Candidatus Kentron sp. TC]
MVFRIHSRYLDHHSNVHPVAPAGSINKEKRQYRTKDGYPFNHKALAKVFRAKMLDAITDEESALPEIYPEQWDVDCKSIGAGEKALIYLDRYLYRCVIQERTSLAPSTQPVTRMSWLRTPFRLEQCLPYRGEPVQVRFDSSRNLSVQD